MEPSIILPPFIASSMKIVPGSWVEGEGGVTRTCTLHVFAQKPQCAEQLLPLQEVLPPACL